MNNKNAKLFCLMFAIMQLAVSGILNAAETPNTENQACEIGIQAYIYAYPIVIMEITRQVGTNTPAVTDIAAPMNQFYFMRTFPSPAFCTVVRPNADTLYSQLWFDVSKEPLVISVPDTSGRYYLLQMLDMWTDVFASPGTRTTGTNAGNFAIVGPEWKGNLSEGIERLCSPTNIGWVLGRVQTNGVDDYKNVHQIQDGIKATPLSQFGKLYRAPTNLPVDPHVDMKTPPPLHVAKMSAQKYFELFAKLLKDNPPHKLDGAMAKKLEQIGIVPGQDFDFSKLNPDVRKGLVRAVGIAQKKIIAKALNPDKLTGGWQKTCNETGKFETHYLQRAVIALTGLGANLPEDAIYYGTLSGTKGKPYSGKNQYVIRFGKSELPPVNAFWSITMYNKNGYFVDNPINRYSIGSKDNFQFNKDGSLNIYIQHKFPGEDKKSNWLPAPEEDDFNMVLRLYWPKDDVLNSRWNPPAVEQEE